MKKVHISLVGGQPMPVFVGIKESGADKLILVHSYETKSAANKIAEYVARLNDIKSELVEIPAMDYNTAKSRIDSILKCHEEDDVTVNVSGGSKPWSIAIALLSYKYTNVRIIYIDQNCRIYNINNNEEPRLAHPFDGGIKQILDYNMNSSESHIELASYTEQDLSILDEIKTARKHFPKAFNTLTIPSKANKNRYNNNLTDRIEDYDTGSSIEWDRRKKGMQEVKLYLAKSYGIKGEPYEFKSPHAFSLVISSGWFEYEVAKVLSGWDKAKEIWLNVVFPYNNRLPKNEIDIIVNTGYKLLFVECKTQIFDNTDIDKFASAVKAYGGMGSKAIFISMEPMKPQAEEKCQTNNIACYSMHKKDKTSKGITYNPRKRKELYDFLDSIMPNTNTR